MCNCVYFGVSSNHKNEKDLYIFELSYCLMRKIENLNIEESINRQRLVFAEKSLDIFDRFTVYVLFGALAFYNGLTIYKADFNGFGDIIITVLLLLFGIYVIYRKATEKRLFKIKTSFDRKENRKILLEFADEKKLEIYMDSKECIILNDAFDKSDSSYKKTMIFIIEDDLVLFTILKDQYRLNIPTLTTHIFVKYNLSKMLNNRRLYGN